MARILKTAVAEADLDDIWLYIAQDNPSAADGLLDKIGASAANFAKQPLSGRARDDLLEDLRRFPVDAYIVFYQPLPDGINIVRVLHSARDQNRAFSSNR